MIIYRYHPFAMPAATLSGRTHELRFLRLRGLASDRPLPEAHREFA